MSPFQEGLYLVSNKPQDKTSFRSAVQSLGVVVIKNHFSYDDIEVITTVFLASYDDYDCETSLYIAAQALRARHLDLSYPKAFRLVREILTIVSREPLARHRVIRKKRIAHRPMDSYAQNRTL